MERPVGEQFLFKGVTLEVEEIPGNYCLGCYFHNELIPCYFQRIKNIIGFCQSYKRTDHKGIIFKKIEK